MKKKADPQNTGLPKLIHRDALITTVLVKVRQTPVQEMDS